MVSTICQREIDWLWIDCEHGWAASVEGTGAACVLARSRGVAPVIRVAWNDPALIKKALDIGAVGVMVPQVRGHAYRLGQNASGTMVPHAVYHYVQVQNAAEAKAAVDAARYYPEGMRGISPPWTALAGMGMDNAVLKQIQEETVVMVQLESEESYNNLHEIAAVPGVRTLMTASTPTMFSLRYFANGYVGRCHHGRAA